MVGEGTETMATITLPLNATAEQIAEAFGEAQEFVQDARQVDENYIGTFSGIRVTVAEGVDRAHGEHVISAFELIDASGDYPDGGRIESLSGGVISEIIVTGAPQETFSVRHIGGGVLEVRLTPPAHGSMISILTDGRWMIESGIIHAFILNMQKDRVYA